MKNKIVSVFVILSIMIAAIGYAVVLDVHPAYAHNNTVKVDAVCNTTTGQYDVLFKVSSDYNLEADIISQNPVIPGLPTHIPKKGSVQTILHMPGNTVGSVTYTATVRWTDGYTDTDTDSDILDGKCVAKTPTPTKTLTPTKTATSTKTPAKVMFHHCDQGFPGNGGCVSHEYDPNHPPEGWVLGPCPEIPACFPTATNTATLTPTNTATNTPTNTATATEVQCDWLNQELINGECVDFTPTPTDTSVPTVTNTATDTAVPVCTEQGEPQYSNWSPYIPDPNDPTHLIRWRTYVVYDLYDTEHVCDSGIEWDDPILAPTPTGTPIVEVSPTPGEVVVHEGQGCITYRPDFITKLMKKGIYDPAAYYPQLNKICPPPSAGKNPLEGTVVTRMGALK